MPVAAPTISRRVRANRQHFRSSGSDGLVVARNHGSPPERSLPLESYPLIAKVVERAVRDIQDLRTRTVKRR